MTTTKPIRDHKMRRISVYEFSYIEQQTELTLRQTRAETDQDPDPEFEPKSVYLSVYL